MRDYIRFMAGFVLASILLLQLLAWIVAVDGGRWVQVIDMHAVLSITIILLLLTEKR